MNRVRFLVCAVGILVLAALGNVSLGEIIVVLNSDFSISGDPLNPPAGFGWRTDQLFGDPPLVSGGIAQFDVTDAPEARQLEQPFLLPAGVQTLAFEFLLTTAVAGNSGQAPDSFQATLYDTAFNPLFPSGDPAFFSAFFSIDNSGPTFFDPAFVSMTALAAGWERVTVDLSSLPSQDLLLDFSLLGSDDGSATQVALDNVVLTQQSAVPEPAGLAVLTLLAIPIIRWRGLTRARREIEYPTKSAA